MAKVNFGDYTATFLDDHREARLLWQRFGGRFSVNPDLVFGSKPLASKVVYDDAWIQDCVSRNAVLSLAPYAIEYDIKEQHEPCRFSLSQYLHLDGGMELTPVSAETSFVSPYFSSSPSTLPRTAPLGASAPFATGSKTRRRFVPAHAGAKAGLDIDNVQKRLVRRAKRIHQGLSSTPTSPCMSPDVSPHRLDGRYLTGIPHDSHWVSIDRVHDNKVVLKPESI